MYLGVVGGDGTSFGAVSSSRYTQALWPQLRSNHPLVGGFGVGFGVWGLEFEVWGWGLGFGVWSLGFGVWGLGLGVWGFGSRVPSLAALVGGPPVEGDLRRKQFNPIFGYLDRI